MDPRAVGDRTDPTKPTDRSDPNSSPDGTQPDRRGVLRAAGALGAVALTGSALAGCSASSTASGNGGDGGGGSAGAAGDGIPLSEVPVGGGTVVAADKAVVTQPEAGTYKAFDSTCPHQGCAVSMVTADGIICPCHGSVFDPSTGERRSGPARSGLTPKTVTVTGDHLTVA